MSCPHRRSSVSPLATWCGVLLLCLASSAAWAANAPGKLSLEATEQAFIDYLDAVGAVGYIESGGTSRFADKTLDEWMRLRDARRSALNTALARVPSSELAPADQRAVAAMRESIDALAADETTSSAHTPTCADAQSSKIGYADMRAALVECFAEHGNQLSFDGRTINRGTALQLLHVEDEPARRKAIFAAFMPLWTAINGRNQVDSPYRRMIRMAADDAMAKRGSEIDAAARAIGADTPQLERWLVQILEAWRDANPSDPIEPWDYRYVNGKANRELEAKITAEKLLPVNERFYRDLGADLAMLHVVLDLAPRPDKSPLAYSDFLSRGRLVDGEWRRPIARVLGNYPTGGLFSLNELVHEIGHAVHLTAIRTRPAYMDWPDTLFAEAFADVPAWSAHEPAWQRRYLGTEVAEAVSMRALFSNVMLDVAWSVFEIRMLRDRQADPNAVWTDITHHYLRIVPHPEVPWWAMRVQLASDPGYMVNYGLGAVLTAELRTQTIDAIGAFDAGNKAWYGWLSERLLQFGSERDTRSLMQALLERPVGPAALLEQIKRCSTPTH